eukprot:CAMPEP_0206461986 /NCGR_PEP_ID=MMETSP0324_2-20121206/25699_1 /ASSEMBLY_ACC=CAM_ASM_000836 /TAXON_ID=2866 /ORGANISM="Crypthecodinium cohnii, Strain Seligo" /LENGTH=238 /DNA_ID=CAMNT_0053934035 /DNA_START=297 /DNA_END=1010 /DNA_ORIENTATION=-
MSSTQHYRDMLLQEKTRTKELFAKHLREIFFAIDVDSSGMINMDELKEFLNDDSLELQEYMQALEIDAADAKMLFKLLDDDGSGEIDIEEFCDGCLRLKGEAKSLDMNCLLYSSKRVDMKLKHIIDGVDVLIGLLVDLATGGTASIIPEDIILEGDEGEEDEREGVYASGDNNHAAAGHGGSKTGNINNQLHDGKAGLGNSNLYPSQNSDIQDVRCKEEEEDTSATDGAIIVRRPESV